MKKIRIFFSMLLIMSIVFSTILFTKDTTVQAASSIRLNEKSLTLELGRYRTLKVYGTTNNVTWRSGNSWIASVSSTGRVTAKAAGTTTITATVSGKKLYSKVTVLRLKGKELTLAPGKTGTMIVEGTKSIVSWASSDNSIATVADNGKVTAKAAGTATITASVDGKDLIGTVTVIDINPKEIVLELGGLSGFIKTLKLSATPGIIKWSSADNAIATVGSDGRVRAKGAGTTTVTATMNGLKLSSNVKVLQMSEKAFTLQTGATNTLQIYGTASIIRWESNNNSVAVVSENGTVTAVSEGTATVTGFVDGRRVTSKVTVVAE